MGIGSDVRLALRLYRRTPVLTAIAVLSIALSVGATAVVFAAIKAVLLNPLPYAHPERLVLFRSEYPKMDRQSAGDYVFWSDAQEIVRRTRTLESVGVYRNAVFDLAGGPGTTPEALYGKKVSASLFPTLGVAPMLGRNIAIEDDQPGRPEEMILSYGLWVRRFHSDPGVVGRTVTVNGHGCQIIGVMPPEFNFPFQRAAAHTPSPYFEFWAPLSNTPGARQGAMGAVGRLKPGVPLAEAREELATISADLGREPMTNQDRVLKLNPLWDRTVGTASDSLVLLMAAAVLFMLIGCANVANLLLARGVARQREIAVRLAIGAGRTRIVRQLLTESVVLALLGGIGAYGLSAAAWALLPQWAPVTIPRLASARADFGIFGFAVTAAMVNGVLFGIAPALRLARGQAIAFQGFGARGAASGRHDRLRSSLVIAEVAVSVVLVVIGGQLLTSFVRLIRTDPGFDADHVLASVVLPAPERHRDPVERGAFYARLLAAVRALPGVESAGTVDALPFSGENHGGMVNADGGAQMVAEMDVVGGDYLQSMGVRLLSGRWFRGEEMSASNDSAIVNDRMARRFWPHASAIGRRICLDCAPGRPEDWKRVIGVVSSARHASLDDAADGNSVYLAAGAMQNSVFIVVRSEHPGADLETAIRRAIAAIDPNQPVFLSATMRELIADSVAGRRFIMMLLAITGCLALVMSAAGVYGVVSYTTSRRTQEIGIRMAVGATPRDILSLIFRQGFGTVAAGLAIGLCATVPVLELLRSRLVGLDSGLGGPVWIAGAVVAVAASIACWIPARRGTRTDPIAALREE